MSEVMNHVHIPDPDDCKKIEGVIRSISDAKTMIKDKQSYITDAKKELKAYGLTSESIKYLIDRYYKQDNEAFVEQIDENASLYDVIFAKKSGDNNE